MYREEFCYDLLKWEFTLTLFDPVPNRVTYGYQQTMVEVIPCKSAVLRFIETITWEEV